ncbi:hypothetical protein Acid345_1844 [Candidatus Koribacter versatilis Ellin345]|uniref:Uncharacterized protein n=1 Tax=Koribacter versatilis (strain Ellin345) TaxID=204669 RepID=Q1IQK5_KORVE|nr:hypothetical protein [Candidatus Koribacter versatilis]ABF40845.1 hypothetical protein Acid345_1844 [Candidatus Koribacter versatilis Ellin345]
MEWAKTNPAAKATSAHFRQGRLNRAALLPILRFVRRSYDLRFCWMLAVLLCLATSARATAHNPAGLSADDPVFVLPLDPQYATAQPQVSLAYANAAGTPVTGWEVSVFVDAKHCKLVCTFHHKASADPLLDSSFPPVATIRLFSANGPYETVLVLDPAGTSLPKATAQRTLQPRLAVVSSRAFCVNAEFRRGLRVPDVSRVRAAALSFDFDPPVAAPLPLRI